jgi:hypothetical protein
VIIVKAYILHFWAWLKANPAWIIVVVAASAFGGKSVAAKFWKARGTKLEQKLVKAKVRQKVAEAETDLDALDARARVIEEQVAAARGREDVAATDAREALKQRKQLMKKYRQIGPGGSAGVRLLLLTLALSPHPAGADDLPPLAGCAPDVELDGALLDPDALAIIDTYQVERAALCRRIDALLQQRDLLTERVAVEVEATRITREISEVHRLAWVDAMAIRRGPGFGARLADSVRATGGWGAIADAEGTVRGGWGVMIGLSVPMFGRR